MNLTRQDLEAFYAELEMPLYNFALRWTWNPASAQEFVQEAFVRVWERRDRIDRKTLKALLYKIVQNLAINEHRKEKWKAKALRLLSFGDPTATPSPADQRDAGALRQAIEAMPEDLRQTLLLCEFSDLSYEEVGEILGIPSGTVASRKNRALHWLKEWEKGKQR